LKQQSKVDLNNIKKNFNENIDKFVMKKRDLKMEAKQKAKL